MSVRFADQPSSQAVAEPDSQFDILCDGVESSLALVHDSLLQFIDLKDLLLAHHLPPNVLLRTSIVAGNLYRSLSDLKVPMSELIRIVRVYSSPWEQKSEALKKLHENYERKSGELKIALHKLAVLDAEITRVTKESQIQNWERLFSRIQTTQGHGRRWKFKMLDFKKQAALGVDHLREYFQKKSDGIVEEEDLSMQEDETTARKVVSGEEPQSSLLLEDTSPTNLNEVMENDLTLLSEDSDLEKEEEKEEVIQKVMVARGIQAGDLGFLSELQIILNAPLLNNEMSGLDALPIGSKIQYVLEYAGLKLMSEPIPIKKKESNLTSVKPIRQNRMATKWRTTDVEKKPSAEEESQRRKDWTTLTFVIPADVVTGANMDLQLQIMQLSVTFQSSEGYTGALPPSLTVAPINVNDILTSPDITVVYSKGTDTKTEEEVQQSKEPSVFSLLIKDSSPAESDQVSEPTTVVGQAPLQFIWRRTRLNKTSNRASSAVKVQCEEASVDHVEHHECNSDATQSDPPDMCSAAVSPRLQTPQPETILRSVHDEMLSNLEEKLQAMQNEYEERLQILANEMQAGFVKQPTTVESEERAVSAFSIKTRTSSSVSGKRKSASTVKSRYDKSVDWNVDPFHEELEKATDRSHDAPPPTRTVMKSHAPKNSASSRPWPEDFLERLELFNSLSTQHKQELTKRIQAEVGRVIELRLAEAYKLITREPDDLTDTLKDVSLPALFMPQTNSTGTVYNPRAFQYFHPIGLRNLRLCQPPSIFQLPPIKPQQVSVLNMFDMTRKIRSRRQGSGKPAAAAEDPNLTQGAGSKSIYDSSTLMGPSVTMVSITHNHDENSSKL